jgi:hypothetical protein
MALQMSPEILDWIQLRRPGGKPFQFQSSFLCGHEILHQPAAVARQSVPDHQKLPRHMTQQMLENLDDLRPLDRARK